MIKLIFQGTMTNSLTKKMKEKGNEVDKKGKFETKVESAHLTLLHKELRVSVLPTMTNNNDTSNEDKE